LGLVGGLVSGSARTPWSICFRSRWGVVSVIVGCTLAVPCPGPGGAGVVLFCMSSIRFTLEVLDLVFMVGAGDGEMGGEGESSPATAGIDQVGGLAVLLAL